MCACVVCVCGMVYVCIMGCTYTHNCVHRFRDVFDSKVEQKQSAALTERIGELKDLKRRLVPILVYFVKPACSSGCVC